MFLSGLIVIVVATTDELSCISFLLAYLQIAVYLQRSEATQIEIDECPSFPFIRMESSKSLADAVRT